VIGPVLIILVSVAWEWCGTQYSSGWRPIFAYRGGNQRLPNVSVANSRGGGQRSSFCSGVG